MKKFTEVVVKAEKIVGGGQALGQLESGKKVFIWGALPGELARVQIVKNKSTYCEAVVVEILESSSERVEPRDSESYLSTSPWQIMNFAYETRQKEALIQEAFRLHAVDLPREVTIKTDEREYEYRNKMEYSFWWDNDREALDLAFFRRGTHGKIPIEKSSLACPEITKISQEILNILRQSGIEGRALKTLLIRCDRGGEVCAQIYVKDKSVSRQIDHQALANLNAANIEVIYSNPQSPASVITEKLFATSDKTLRDDVLGVKFNYATEGFFQINLLVYEMALRDIQRWIKSEEVVDMYSGVGTIGLTIGGAKPTLVETNAAAVEEMRRNVQKLGSAAKIVHAKSEEALSYITLDADLIVDPPRAGLHDDVVREILHKKPPRVIYLSCNPVTQARDVAKLLDQYEMAHHQGYNFFPHTPHIEHLVILEKK